MMAEDFHPSHSNRHVPVGPGGLMEMRWVLMGDEVIRQRPVVGKSGRSHKSGVVVDVGLKGAVTGGGLSPEKGGQAQGMGHQRDQGAVSVM